MNRIRKWSLLGIVLCAVPGSWADAPIQWRGSKGWEPESAYCRLYDSKTIVTLKGTVERVEKVTPMKGMGYGVYLMLKTSSESIPVHLGPTEFVEKQSVQIRTKDTVIVTGSRVSCDGKPVILAATIKRGDETVTFRALKGSPAWATSPDK